MKCPSYFHSVLPVLKVISLFAVLVSSDLQTTQKKPPNIIFILADDAVCEYAIAYQLLFTLVHVSCYPCNVND